MSARSANWGELAGLVKVRPLTAPVPPMASWNGTYTSPFSAALASTLDILRREIKHLKPREVILEADFRENQLRNDGLPKATATAASPGIVLTLVGTPHGDLRYPCATFGHWDENLRGIALSLEAQRKMDRYGVTRNGEQYAGWKALPAGRSEPSAERGRALIAEHGSLAAALKATHPDHGGDAADFADVQAARERS